MQEGHTAQLMLCFGSSTWDNGDVASSTGHSMSSRGARGPRSARTSPTIADMWAEVKAWGSASLASTRAASWMQRNRQFTHVQFTHMQFTHVLHPGCSGKGSLWFRRLKFFSGKLFVCTLVKLQLDYTCLYACLGQMGASASDDTRSKRDEWRSSM